MRHGKTTALKCLPLATELLIVFLTADILWQLLCGRPPFSMWGFLLSGGLMTAGNSLFLQKPRRFWQILLLNVLLCAVWIPLLSRTLDLTYPPLLVIQVPLYLFPLCRGYHWGVTPVTVRHLHGAGEYMGLYGLFYLIVASFAPQLLDRVPVLLALLALDLLAVVGMRTSGRNTIRAGSPFGRLPALLVPAVLALLAVAACALLLAARGELIPIFQAVGSLLEGALIAVFRFLTSLFQGRSAGSAGMSSAAGGGSEAALPVESASGPAIAPQLVTALLLLSLAALVLAGVAAESGEERVRAQMALADVPLKRFLNEAVVPYEDDEVTRLIMDSHDSQAFAPISSFTVGQFRDWLLSDAADTAALTAVAPGVTPEMAAAVSKIMRLQDLVSVASKCRVVVRFRDTLGLKGRFATRLQPNHPTDDAKGILAATIDGLYYGSGDAVIGINPATDSLPNITRLLYMLDGLISRYHIPTQSCVLTHVTNTIELINRGVPVDLTFQSLAGTEKANASFGISLSILDEAWDATKSLRRGTNGSPSARASVSARPCVSM